MNCKHIRAAIKANENKLYPYIVIDRTNYARVNGLQVYIDILDKFMRVIIDGIVKVLVPDKEFKEKRELTNDGYAKPKPASPKEPKENIQEQIAKKLRESSRKKSKRLKRRMSRDERKRRRRV